MSFNIQTFPQSKIESLASNNGLRSALISITQPGQKPVSLHKDVFTHTLRVMFDDVEKGTMPILVGRGQGMPPICVFNCAQANQILEYVDRIKGDIDVLAIHCLMGISRSTAVAYAVQTLFQGDNVCPDKWSGHNTHVYNTLIECYSKTHRN